MTEANATAYRDTSPNGLFAPDEYLTWLENGAFSVDWWDMHNGTDCAEHPFPGVLRHRRDRAGMPFRLDSPACPHRARGSGSGPPTASATVDFRWIR
ncbi:hypothetical protein AQI88_37990 [Streptomyces cellostaticus]|uniref:Uncharacterized protein n=1 Tax=Streptomyces cellostaticus TaxID=67285 RepID=A0A101NDI4_9ACTN|nr:hypothetical protein [Streptomyces cellostaticus]KUM91211.1 hypothetical protein AQI88_37990 [Streptomyces cellostaticus]GHI03590.1 hypothetical protein Scel_19110 [Streptomyces cellostaticus]